MASHVYTGKKGLKLVTNDYETLLNLISNKPVKTDYKRTIMIDDSGQGFAIGGTLIGIYDSLTKTTITREISIEFYQGDKFENKEYINEYARQGMDIIQNLKINKQDTLIKI